MENETFWECYFNNNPDSLAELAIVVAPDVLALISTGPTVEVASGVVDGFNTTFTLAGTPSPSESLSLSLINGGITYLVDGVDFTAASIAGTFTIEMVVPPAIGEFLNAYYYEL